MKMIKVYKWDCIIRWVAFGVFMFFALISEDFLNLFSYPYPINFFIFLMFLYMVPVHPIFWLISLIYSIKEKQKKSIIFSILAPFLSVVFFCIFFLIHGIWAGMHGA